MKKWNHKAMIATTNGKVKVYCVCGWQSPKRPVGEAVQMMDLYTQHVGLIERHVAK